MTTIIRIPAAAYSTKCRETRAAHEPLIEERGLVTCRTCDGEVRLTDAGWALSLTGLHVRGLLPADPRGPWATTEDVARVEAQWC